jgi:Zn-dependent protease with chaperone function
MSSVVYLQPLIWSLMYVDLLVFGTPAGLSQLIGGWLLDLVVSKPGNRQQESEADHVGLMLMAQACYDPKEAPRFWERMEKANELAPPEWLSTHPSVSIYPLPQFMWFILGIGQLTKGPAE